MIFAGDFNVDKNRFRGAYANMLNALQTSSPIFSGYTESTFDPRINVHAQNIFSGSSQAQYIDYIFASDEFGTINEITNEVLVPRSSDSPLWQIWDLSDHFPVRALVR